MTMEVADHATEVANLAREAADQATEVANLAREAADGAKEFIPSHHPTSPPTSSSSPPNKRFGERRNYLARGEAKRGEAGRKSKARRDEKRKKERKEIASADLSLLFSFQIYIPTQDINTILSQVLGTVRNGVGH